MKTSRRCQFWTARILPSGCSQQVQAEFPSWANGRKLGSHNPKNHIIYCISMAGISKLSSDSSAIKEALRNTWATHRKNSKPTDDQHPDASFKKTRVVDNKVCPGNPETATCQMLSLKRPPGLLLQQSRADSCGIWVGSVLKDRIPES